MQNRLSSLRAALSRREIDAAIITAPKNIGYLCGFFYDDGYLFITEKSAFIVTDFRYEEEAAKFAFADFEIVTPKDRLAFLNEVCKKESIRSIGFESASMTVAEYNRFSSALAVSYVPMGDVLTEMRSKKSGEEIETIRHAQGIADRAFSHILTILDPRMTETEVALELGYFMQKQGASGCSFETIAVSGSASALPHGKCRNIPLSHGFLTMDFGCVYQGYCSDMTRTVVIGKATDEMKRLYNTVLEAQLAALSVIKSGALAKDVDAIARTIIDSAGYKGAFGHGLGHGVGLDIHELPRLSPSAEEVKLEAGNIVTVEPGIYLAGKYGCRIEDMGCVTEDGFDNFTASRKDLIELFV